jgi:Zn-dependent peptidase ImmA (M78 family)/transcriptional regulator with XRE-family HTH domain
VTEGAFNPRMLTLRRELLGLTQAALAEACGVSQSLISKVEAGMIPIPPEVAESLGSALEAPLDFFFTEARVYGYGSACFHHRKRADVTVKRLRSIQARVNLLRIQIERLLAGVEIATARQFNRLPIDEHGRPDHVARLVRSMWSLPMGPVENLAATVEAAGGIVLLLDFGTSRIDAVSQWVEGTPPLLFLNERQPGDRLRWTLAHEVGHLVMHEAPSPEQEREADAFAAEVLMPAHEIVTELEPVTLPHLAQLKIRWRVSIAALLRRARDLDLVSEAQYRRLFTRYNFLGFRHGEPVPVSVEQPSLVRRVLHLHLEEHGYTVSDLAKLTLVKEQEFTEMFLPEAARSLRVIHSR